MALDLNGMLRNSEVCRIYIDVYRELYFFFVVNTTLFEIFFGNLNLAVFPIV